MASVLDVISRKKIEMIDRTSKDILIKIGLRINNKKIQDMLYSHGAKVNGDVVKFNEDLIEKGLTNINGEYSLYGRNLKKAANLTDGNFSFLSTAGQHAIIDHLRAERRAPILEDLIQGARLADALENIDIVGAFVVPNNIEVKKRDVMSAYNLLKNTEKPIALWINNGNSAKKIISMFEAVRGSSQKLKKYPICFAFIEAISPLQYTGESLDVLYEFAKKGLPLGFGPMAMTFATAPGTLAGTLAVENAEIIAGIIIARIINPGVPVCYWGIQHILDNQTGNISFGSPEQVLMALASIQLAKYYRVPVGTNTGITDAIFPDSQSGTEKGITACLALLAGCNIFGHQGIAGADQGASLVQLFIDNETIGYIKRIRKGFEVSEATLLFDEIDEIGIGGNYLASDSTFKNFKKEVWFPGLFERKNWENWKKDNKDIVRNAWEGVEKKLEGFKEKEERYLFGPDVGKELADIIDDKNTAIERR